MGSSPNRKRRIAARPFRSNCNKRFNQANCDTARSRSPDNSFFTRFILTRNFPQNIPVCIRGHIKVVIAALNVICFVCKRRRVFSFVLPIQTITENAVINGNGDITVGYRLGLSGKQKKKRNACFRNPMPALKIRFVQ